MNQIKFLPVSVKAVLILIFMSNFTACCQCPPVSYQPAGIQPVNLPDGIITGTLQNAKMDSNTIATLTHLIITDTFHNIHSLLIMKDDRLVYENYFPGKDQKHGKKLGCIGHYTSQLHDCRSISKAVVSACIGIAI